jgi:bidirectional [NiFe] hydrogenase diaphorase subunit
MTPVTTEKSAPKAAPKAATVDKRFKALEVAMKRQHYSQDALIEVLHQAQGSFGFLEPEVLEFIARRLKLPLSRVHGVATFYHLFSLKPSGKHTCVVCTGTACYVKGSGKIVETLVEKLGIAVGETTPDGEISISTARCIGACGIAPAFVFDGDVKGKLDADGVMAHLQSLVQQD